MAPRRLGDIWIVVTVCAAVLVLTFVVFGLFVFRTIDYGQMPRAEVFRSVWKRELPRAVTRLDIAGHGAGQGHWIWMVVDAPPSTLRGLIGHSRPISAADFWNGCWDGNSADATAVHWDQVDEIRGPQFYDFDATVHVQGWYGVMALDPDRGRLYVMAGML